MKSLSKFNLVEIPVIDRNNRIIAGNMRISALRTLGRGNEIIEVRVPSRDLTEEEAREYLIRSNKNTGEWDFALLVDFGEDMLKDIGWESEKIDEIFQNNSDYVEKNEENEEELADYKRIHILISIDPKHFDEIQEEINLIKNKIIGKGEYEQGAN